MPRCVKMGEAIKWTGDNWEEVRKFLREREIVDDMPPGLTSRFRLVEFPLRREVHLEFGSIGGVRVQEGDYLVCRGNGIVQPQTKSAFRHQRKAE